MTITLRAIKGSALNIAEFDANFTTLRDVASQTSGTMTGVTIASSTLSNCSWINNLTMASGAALVSAGSLFTGADATAGRWKMGDGGAGNTALRFIAESTSLAIIDAVTWDSSAVQRNLSLQPNGGRLLVGGTTDTTRALVQLKRGSNGTTLEFGSTGNEGGYLVSTGNSQAILGCGVYWDGGSWIARAATVGYLELSGDTVQYRQASGQVAGNPVVFGAATLTFTAGGTLQLTDGSHGSPTHTFRDQTTVGMYRLASNTLGFATPPGDMLWDGAVLYLQVNTAQIYMGASNDVQLVRDAAADILAMRRTTNAQAFRMYNTYTDASNYERVRFEWNSNKFSISTQGLGTGTIRHIEIGTEGGTSNLYLRSNGQNRWRIAANAGELLAETDNTHDIGATGANRPRNVFIAGNITIGDAAALVKSSVAMNNGAGAGAGTITNAPTAGNPTKWVPINDNGTTRYIPAW